ncbi:WD40-repeat-containing domain protein, partial [Halteromyces radiatus]|uniref:WD40-repeat-containing domain protein n=1 Tax=Halteromyces radiatus TaxID=101107 RepID=UPI0022207C64
VSGRSILQRFQCYEDQIYYFYFPDYTSCTPFVCDYAHSANDGNLLAVPDEEGRISIIRTDKSNDISQGQYHCSFYCHANAVVDVKWSRDDTMLLTSAADSKSRIMDVETQQCLGTFIGHRAILRSGNWHPTNPRKYLGSYPMYGPIKAVPDAHVEPNSIIKKKRPVKTITAGRTVTCALFYPNEEEKVITSGSFDGAIKLWDCRAGRSPSTLQATHFQQNGRRKGISDMKIDHSETRLFSVCMDSSIYMHYLLDLTEPARRYTDPSYNSSCFTIKLSVSHDDQFLLAGSNNSNNVYAWDVDGDPTVAHAFEGHTDTVSGVAWHKSNNYQVNGYKMRKKKRLQ